MKSLVDIMKPSIDIINYEDKLMSFFHEEMEKCKDFQYWFSNYYKPLRENDEWVKEIAEKWRDQD